MACLRSSVIGGSAKVCGRGEGSRLYLFSMTAKTTQQVDVAGSCQMSTPLAAISGRKSIRNTEEMVAKLEGCYLGLRGCRSEL
jgi:hypothetical protein